MSRVTIEFGPNNEITKEISHTREVRPEWLEFLGASPENVELTIGGVVYDGALADGSRLAVRQKTNSKG